MFQQNKDASNRECTRIPRGVQLEVKKLAYPLSADSGEKCSSRNIAKQGVCFTAASCYKAGEVLSLSMKLNGWHRHRKGLTAILNDELSKTDVLTVIAEVIWAKASSSAEGYDIGVKFINIYEDDMHALEKYFSRLIS